MPPDARPASQGQGDKGSGRKADRLPLEEAHTVRAVASEPNAYRPGRRTLRLLRCNVKNARFHSIAPSSPG
ncbi:hypothetical protein MTBSS4_270042 [Magnetospirillum sp. SS-4]|nr:hypothetical protein MTBSS4_270042 [Magnetospirillum sp. SS-4]